MDFHVISCSVDATADNGRMGRLLNDAVGTMKNCIMKVIYVEGTPKLCLFANRDINAGEELRYDYGVENLPWREVSKTRIMPVCCIVQWCERLKVSPKYVQLVS